MRQFYGWKVGKFLGISIFVVFVLIPALGCQTVQPVVGRSHEQTVIDRQDLRWDPPHFAFPQPLPGLEPQGDDSTLQRQEQHGSGQAGFGADVSVGAQQRQR